MKFSYIFLLGIFLVSFASAIPPIQSTVIVSTGIELETPIMETHIANQDFSFHVHAYNATNGIRLTNSSINCIIHLYNGSNGHHLIENNMTFDSNGIDFQFDVNGGNFSILGQYAVLFDCQDTSIGGFIEYGFMVTENGKKIPTGLPTFILGIILLVFLTACFFIYLSSQMGEGAFKIFFLMLSIIFLMASFITTYMYSSDANVLSGINTTTLSLVYVLGMILIILFVYMLIRQTINALDLFRIKKGLAWDVGAGSKVGGYNTKKAY